MARGSRQEAALNRTSAFISGSRSALKRKAGEVLENGGTALREKGAALTAEADRTAPAAAPATHFRVLSAPSYPADHTDAEAEFISRRFLLGHHRGGWQMIGRSANALTFDAITQARLAEGRHPMPMSEAEMLMDSGVIHSSAPSDQVFYPSYRRSPAAEAAESYPKDPDDLARCEITYHLAPEHLRQYMLPQLKQWRKAVIGDEDKEVGMNLAPDQTLLDAFYPVAA